MIMQHACETGLIEAADLAPLLAEKKDTIRLIDASYAVPGGTAGPKAFFTEKHLPGAVFFDIDEIADRSSGLPHMLPSADAFAEAVGQLGIGSGDMVVVYDQTGVALAAARAWWMFRVFGHDRVCVLNGGLPAWQAAGLPLKSGKPKYPPAGFEAHFCPDLVRGQAEMGESRLTVIDARSAERYAGKIPEPRPGLRRGHIPGSLNVPFANLIGPDGRLLDKATLSQRLNMPNSGHAVSVYCGSGLTACVPALAFFTLGKKNISVYDGSWAEWGEANGSRPVEG